MVLEYHVNVFWCEVYQAWPENSPAHVMVTPDKLHIKGMHMVFLLKHPSHTQDRAKVVLKWAASWENQQSEYAKTKTQISFAVIVKLISAFVFATWIVQSLYFLNTKFQASSHLQWMHRLACVRPGSNSTSLVFSCCGSNCCSSYSVIDVSCFFFSFLFDYCDVCFMCDEGLHYANMSV